MPAVPRVIDRGGVSILGSSDCRYARLDTVVDYSGRVKRAHMCYAEAQDKALKSLMPPSMRARMSDFDDVLSTSSTGRARLDKIRHTLASLGLTWSEAQREFINRMIAACAKLIFKDDLQDNIEDLLSELGIDALHQELMAIMPRRNGKTFSVGGMVVALISAIEGLEIGVFSTGRRASQKMQELIYWFMTKLGTLNIIKHNVESIWIEGPSGPIDTRKISSFYAWQTMNKGGEADAVKETVSVSEKFNSLHSMMVAETPTVNIVDTPPVPRRNSSRATRAKPRSPIQASRLRPIPENEVIESSSSRSSSRSSSPRMTGELRAVDDDGSSDDESAMKEQLPPRAP